MVNKKLILIKMSFTELEYFRMGLANKISDILGDDFTLKDVITVAEMPLYTTLTRKQRSKVGKLIPIVCYSNIKNNKGRLYCKYILNENGLKNLTIYYILEIFDFVIIDSYLNNYLEK